MVNSSHSQLVTSEHRTKPSSNYLLVGEAAPETVLTTDHTDGVITNKTPKLAKQTCRMLYTLHSMPESHVTKHLRISLALKQALGTILFICGLKLSQ